MTSNSKNSFWKRLIIMITILGLAVVAGKYWYPNYQLSNLVTTTHQQKNQTPKSYEETSDKLIPVSVAPVHQGDFNTYLSGLGVVTPINSVEVSSRVDGQLMSISFKEGQIIKKGVLLAQIDPTPFKVQLGLATGQLMRDQTLLDNAQTDLNRYRKLLKQNSTSLQLVESKESLVRQYKAAVQADHGRVTGAKLQLTYARIIAPISGRVGFRHVDAGNIVRASDTKSIVTITQLDPISVIFPIPEDALPRVMKLLSTDKHIPVEIYDRALKEKIGEGQLVATDNQIDSATGTIKLKAQFDNPDGTLFANQFVNVRMSVKTQAKATLLPTAAIQHGTIGTFVYVVKKDQSVVVTPIDIGLVQGEVASIENGVSAGEVVVIEGADRLREGTKVKIIEAHPTASTPSER